MHLPVGIMLDRFGPRKIMTGCILLTVVGLMPLIFADHWIYPIAGRFLIGLGSSAAILGVFKIIRMTFSEARFPRMLSLSVTIGLIGAIYGGGPVSFMREKLGYQTVCRVIRPWQEWHLAAITYWIVPNVKSALQSTILSDIKEVLGNGKSHFLLHFRRADGGAFGRLCRCVGLGLFKASLWIGVRALRPACFR